MVRWMPPIPRSACVSSRPRGRQQWCAPSARYCIFWSMWSLRCLSGWARSARTRCCCWQATTKAASAPVFVLIGINYMFSGLFGICALPALTLHKRSRHDFFDYFRRRIAQYRAESGVDSALRRHGGGVRHHSPVPSRLNIAQIHDVPTRTCAHCRMAVPRWWHACSVLLAVAHRPFFRSVRDHVASGPAGGDGRIDAGDIRIAGAGTGSPSAAIRWSLNGTSVAEALLERQAAAEVFRK